MNEFNYIQLSDEQKEQLYQEFKLRARIEEEAREGEFDIPEEILENLDNTSKGELKIQFKKHHKSLPQYKRETWTSAETINKCFHADLKRDNLDSYQVVCRDYKHSEKLLTAATAATEIYEELNSLIDGENHVLINALEKARRLAVFAFANTKFIDQEAKELAAKALKLPPSIRNFAEEEETDKILAFSSEKVEQVHKARFEQSLLRNASRSGYSNRGGFQQRGRGNQPFRNSFRGNFSGQKSFFGGNSTWSNFRNQSTATLPSPPQQE